jgi:hypothetical protein
MRVDAGIGVRDESWDSSMLRLLETVAVTDFSGWVMVVLEITVRSGVVEWHQTVSGKYGLERRSGWLDFLRRHNPRQVRRVFPARREISALRSMSTPVLIASIGLWMRAVKWPGRIFAGTK